MICSQRVGGEALICTGISTWEVGDLQPWNCLVTNPDFFNHVAGPGVTIGSYSREEVGPLTAYPFIRIISLPSASLVFCQYVMDLGNASMRHSIWTSSPRGAPTSWLSTHTLGLTEINKSVVRVNSQSHNETMYLVFLMLWNYQMKFDLQI